MADLIQKMNTFELGLNVTVTGVALVFSMLVSLVLILILFGKIFVALQNAAEKKAEKTRAATLSQMQDDKSDTLIINEDDGISEEVIAVISAAVATLYMGSSKKPVIRAIKKSNGRRSAWGNAGVANNTRAF